MRIILILSSTENDFLLLSGNHGMMRTAMTDITEATVVTNTFSAEQVWMKPCNMPCESQATTKLVSHMPQSIILPHHTNSQNFTKHKLAKNRCTLLHGSAEEASNLPSWTQNSFTNKTSAWPALITINYIANFPMCIWDDTFETYISTAFFKINTDGSSHTLLKHAVMWMWITLALFHHQSKTPWSFNFPIMV